MKPIPTSITLALIAGALIFAPGCGKEEPEAKLVLDTSPVLTFGFLPYADRTRMKAMFDGLSGHLNQHLDHEVRFVLSPDYETIGDLMARKMIDLAWLTPASYSKVGRKVGCKILCKTFRRGKPTYKSHIVVRADSTYQTLADLKGTRFAYVDRNSTSGFIMPNRLLAEAGFPDPLVFFKEATFTHSHTESLRLLKEGAFDAAAVYENAARTVDEPEKIRLLMESPPIPNDPIVVRPDLDPTLVARIKDLFLRMHELDSGKAGLQKLNDLEQITQFIPADDAEFQF